MSTRFEHVARIAVKRRPVMLVHADLHLRDLFAQPRHGDQCAGDRQANTVGVALIEAKAGGLDRAAQHVEREHGAGQQQPVAVHALEFADGYPLAARNAHLVGEQQVDKAHPGVLVQPGSGLRKVRELRHDDPIMFRI